MAILAIYPWLIPVYAYAIYCSGSNRLSTIPAQYRIPVMQYAAANYSSAQIQVALINEWITQEEYDATMAYVV
jgi:hypothetical protein